jgi:hypothetical protein
MTTNPIQLHGSYFFYGKKYDEIYLSENGLMSFGEEFPDTQPRNLGSASNPPLIAGFYTNISNVHIFYRQLTANLCNEYDMNRFYEACNISMQLISRKFDDSVNDFNPTHISIFTWANATKTEQSDQKINFQILLVSDNTTQATYALLLYNQIEWNESDTEGVQVAFSHPNLSSYILPFKTLDLDSESNVNMSGVYVYRIDQEHIIDGQLALTFTNDTPLVLENQLMINFKPNRPNVTINCSIPRLGLRKMECSSGSFAYNFTRDEILQHGVKRYRIYVEAKDEITDEIAGETTDEIITLSGQFRVFGHQEKYFCSVNMINTGTRPIQKGGSVEYVSVGKHITNFKCRMVHLPRHHIITKCSCGKMVRNDTHGRPIYSLNIPEELQRGETYRLVVKPTAGCGLDFCHKQSSYEFEFAV